MHHNPGFLRLVEQSRAHVRECTVDEVQARLDRREVFHFVDVREDDEVRLGMCAGAVHLGRGVLERDVETRIPAHDADVVLYCGGGFRSVLAAESLQRMGYTNVRSMAGGFRAWRERGLPLAAAAERG